MQTKIEFFAKMNPPTRTEQQHRVYIKNGRPIFVRDAKLREAISQIETAVEPFIPEEPIDEPVYVKIIWLFPYKKTEKKSNIGEVIEKPTRPDLDNLNKNLLDCLNEKFYKDDSLIVRLTTEKAWYETPGIYVKISTIDHNIFAGKIEAAISKSYLNNTEK